MKETTDTNCTDTVRTIASDAEERGGAIVRYVSVAEGRVARLDAVPSDVLGGGAGYLAANVKTRLGGGLAVAPSTVKPGSMESSVARWKHEVDQVASALTSKWAPNLATSWKSIASHRLTPIVAFGALLALLTALALRLWQQRRWVSAMALGATVTLLAPGCDCTGKQGSGRNPRDASTLIAELPADAVLYHGDWQGSPVATTDATGKVTSRTAYLPYGAERSRKGLGDGAASSGANSEPWSYVGNERDSGSGLSNFHARSYRPELGRFLSVDPVALFQGEEVRSEPMRLEAYTYGSGDPTNQADRDGRFLQLVIPIAQAAAAAVTGIETGVTAAAVTASAAATAYAIKDSVRELTQEYGPSIVSAVGRGMSQQTCYDSASCSGEAVGGRWAASEKKEESRLDVVQHPSQRAARRAAEREAGMEKHGQRTDHSEQTPRAGSQSPQGSRGVRTEDTCPETGRVVHHDPFGNYFPDIPEDSIGPHYGVEGPGISGTNHHTYPSDHDPSTNR